MRAMLLMIDNVSPEARDLRMRLLPLTQPRPVFLQPGCTPRVVGAVVDGAVVDGAVVDGSRAESTAPDGAVVEGAADGRPGAEETIAVPRARATGAHTRAPRARD